MPITSDGQAVKCPKYPFLTQSFSSDIDTTDLNYFSSFPLTQKLPYFVKSTLICLNAIQYLPH